MTTIFNMIDYKLLAHQKAVILELLNRNLLNQEQEDVINGLINFIDAFQDEAVNEHDITEEIVFPKI